MPYTYRATNADELRSILSHHLIVTSDDEINIELALCQPLSDPALIAESRYPQDNPSHYRYEHLSITPLSKSLRPAWVELIRALADARLTNTFDPTLPTYSSDDGVVQGVWWSVVSPDGKGPETMLLIIDRDFWCFVITLATEARMLSRGSVKFILNDVPMLGWRLGSLHKHLENLSR